jgi:hypothetical protein
MITAVDSFRFIRADAVIDADGNGAAEVWDIEAVGPPSQFGEWNGGVSASAAFAIVGGVGGGRGIRAQYFGAAISRRRN